MTVSQKGTAVVTGVSSGIGAIYADRLARRGYNLILVARSLKKLSLLIDRTPASHVYERTTHPIAESLRAAVDAKTAVEIMNQQPRRCQAVSSHRQGNIASYPEGTHR
jgi:short-subunit dehydrogenase